MLLVPRLAFNDLSLPKQAISQILVSVSAEMRSKHRVELVFGLNIAEFNLASTIDIPIIDGEESICS